MDYYSYSVYWRELKHSHLSGSSDFSFYIIFFSLTLFLNFPISDYCSPSFHYTADEGLLTGLLSYLKNSKFSYASSPAYSPAYASLSILWPSIHCSQNLYDSYLTAYSAVHWSPKNHFYCVLFCLFFLKSLSSNDRMTMVFHFKYHFTESSSTLVCKFEKKPTYFIRKCIDRCYRAIYVYYFYKKYAIL